MEGWISFDVAVPNQKLYDDGEQILVSKQHFYSMAAWATKDDQGNAIIDHAGKIITDATHWQPMIQPAK
jgi:hypothetical protein